jgi:hypothetical protein
MRGGARATAWPPCADGGSAPAAHVYLCLDSLAFENNGGQLITVGRVQGTENLTFSDLGQNQKN